MKKIIISTYDDITNPFYGGGGASAVHEIAKRLSKEFDVSVISGLYPQALPRETIDGIRYQRIGFRVGPKLGQILFQMTLPFYVIRLKYDAWLESFTPPISVSFLSLFTKKPVIGCTYLLAGDLMSQKYHLPFKFIQNFGLKFYKNVIVLTETMKKEVLAANSRLDARVIPVGIPRDLIENPLTKTDEFIFYLGRIDINNKGLDLLLQAYKDIAPQVVPKLVIAGGGISTDVEFLKKWITDNGMENKIEYIGKVGSQQKKDLLMRSMFLVVPSRFEGFCIVILEAFSAGSPVVIFDIPDLEWVPREYSSKVKPFDAGLLGQAILKLSLKKMEREKMGQGAKVFSRKFDWDLIAADYAKYINQII